MSVDRDLKRYAEQGARPKLGRPNHTMQLHRTRPAFEDAQVWKIDMERALDRLKQQERTVLLLVYGLGHNMADVCRITGMSRQAVAKLAHESIAKLERIRSNGTDERAADERTQAQDQGNRREHRSTGIRLQRATMHNVRINHDPNRPMPCLYGVRDK